MGWCPFLAADCASADCFGSCLLRNHGGEMCLEAIPEANCNNFSGNDATYCPEATDAPSKAPTTEAPAPNNCGNCAGCLLSVGGATSTLCEMEDYVTKAGCETAEGLFCGGDGVPAVVLAAV